jgi:hypothetical protein
LGVGIVVVGSGGAARLPRRPFEEIIRKAPTGGEGRIDKLIPLRGRDGGGTTPGRCGSLARSASDQ